MRKLLTTSIAAVAAIVIASFLAFSCGEKEPDQPSPAPTPSTVAVSGVSLNKTSLSLTEGGSETLTATVSPSNATNKAVSWTSSDASVANVDSNGKVTASKAGSATITVTTTDGSKTATCSVTVAAKAVPVTGVSLDKTELELTKEETVQLSATVAPDNATDKSLEWASSDTKVATVDNTGKVTAVDAGTAKITVKTKDGGKTAECSVKVNPKEVPVEGVNVQPETLEITEGETAQLKASISPADADQEIEWAAQNSRVATVDQNGLVTAVAPGTTRIIARSKADNDVQGYCELTVKQDASLKGIALSASDMNLNVGGSKTLSVVYTPEYAANKKVTWASSDPSVVTVNEGKVVALKEGTAKVTATSEEGGFTAECVVTVSKAVGPFIYYGEGGKIYIDGSPDPLDGAFDGAIIEGNDKVENNFRSIYAFDYDGKDLYSLERYSYRDWLCVNRKPVIKLDGFNEYYWRLNYELKGFSAKKGVFAVLGRVGEYDFHVLRVTADGDYKDITVHTSANNLIDVFIAVAPDGTVHAVSAFKDTFWDYCLYWYKISPDGKVTEQLVEKTYTNRPRIAVSDKGDVYIFTSHEKSDGYFGRLYKNGKAFKDIDEVENNFQSSLFCSGDHVYTAVADLKKKELRVHKDGKKVLTLGKGKGAYLGYSTNRLWVTSNGDIYVSWSDDDNIYYLTKNDKVLYTAPEDIFWNYCVVE